MVPVKKPWERTNNNNRVIRPVPSIEFFTDEENATTVDDDVVSDEPFLHTNDENVVVVVVMVVTHRSFARKDSHPFGAISRSRSTTQGALATRQFGLAVDLNFNDQRSRLRIVIFNKFIEIVHQTPLFFLHKKKRLILLVY